MLKGIPLPAVLIDIETTGGNVTRDRITEVGVIEINHNGIEEWSTLINPRVHIPYHIQKITGITNEMVADAPYFEEIAKTLLLKMQGKVFIAHNVRFDYGFIKNEYARLAYPFKSALLCTVKLSRALFPEEKSHSLESIIKRHQIYTAHRHRALDDAKATFRFLEIAEERCGEEAMREAVKRQQRQASIPINVDYAMINALPNSPGVYYFWDELNTLLYVGKSIDIRKRVMSHFTSDNSSSKEMRMCQQVKTITFDETAGELGALILESQQVKALQPIYNRRLRRQKYLYTLVANTRDDGLVIAVPVALDANARFTQSYGLFASKIKAMDKLRDLCYLNQLCLQATGLEPKTQRGCSAYQLNRCSGFCVGEEGIDTHNQRLLNALQTHALTAWPYAGPVAFEERNRRNEIAEYFIIDNWRILGKVKDPSDIEDVITHARNQELDRDIYYYLVKHLLKHPRAVQPLGPQG